MKEAKKDKNINYLKISKELLKGLPERVYDVVIRRFGLFGEKCETLESIGKTYNLTRERVRQIECEALSKIKPKMKNYKDISDYFKKKLEDFGGLKEKFLFLSCLGRRKDYNHISFLLNLCEGIYQFKENKDYCSFWTIDKNILPNFPKINNLLIRIFKKEKRPLSLEEILKLSKEKIFQITKKKLTPDGLQSYLEISKQIQSNIDGDWGLKEWIEINPRGIKDKAYLVFKKAGVSLHFKEVADLIKKYFCPSEKTIHVVTVHNELIKDPRFVLVGRGLYALREWGYEPGFVKDMIIKVLKESKKPLSKEEIIQKVLEQRFVKKNTVFLNLQNKRFFQKTPEGRYTIRSA